MLDDRLSGAFIDNGAKHRFLGRRLRPFSLWHKLLLFTIHSPFFNPGVPLYFFDIRTTIGICSLKFPDSRVRRPWLIPLMMVAVHGWPKSRWVKYITGLRNQLLEYFGDYISRPDYSIAPPKIKSETPAPRRCPMSEQFAIVADLVGFLRCPPATAWDMPVGQAYWYQMAAYREKGEDIDYMDVEERQFQNELKKVIDMPRHAQS